MDAADFADACQALAEDLDKEQAALNYAGVQAITLGKLSTNLSAQASSLRTLAVSAAISNSADAVQALKQGTTAVTDAISKLQQAADAIQIAGLVLSLGGAVISENPGSVISSAQSLVNAVKALPA